MAAHSSTVNEILNMLKFPARDFFGVVGSVSTGPQSSLLAYRRLIAVNISEAVNIESHEVIATQGVNPCHLCVANRSSEGGVDAVIEEKSMRRRPVLACNFNIISIFADHLALVVDSAEGGIAGPRIIHGGVLALVVCKPMSDERRIFILADDDASGVDSEWRGIYGTGWIDGSVDPFAKGESMNVAGSVVIDPYDLARVVDVACCTVLRSRIVDGGINRALAQEGVPNAVAARIVVPAHDLPLFVNSESAGVGSTRVSKRYVVVSLQKKGLSESFPLRQVGSVDSDNLVLAVDTECRAVRRTWEVDQAETEARVRLRGGVCSGDAAQRLMLRSDLSLTEPRCRRDLRT